MEDTKIQWHPGFVAAMGMEFKEDREKLDFESEHNLNTRPLEIDLLIMYPIRWTRQEKGIA